ncbi:MAG TPA: hypothetical protein ENI70_00500, partial [Candidatus Peregrinibacteria bacterium]|nr:hypothetical protein [Candidatus Peregrinibacteria bacterium]
MPNSAERPQENSEKTSVKELAQSFWRLVEGNEYESVFLFQQKPEWEVLVSRLKESGDLVSDFALVNMLEKAVEIILKKAHLGKEGKDRYEVMKDELKRGLELKDNTFFADFILSLPDLLKPQEVSVESREKIHGVGDYFRNRAVEVLGSRPKETASKKDLFSSDVVRRAEKLGMRRELVKGFAGAQDILNNFLRRARGKREGFVSKCALKAMKTWKKIYPDNHPVLPGILEGFNTTGGLPNDSLFYFSLLASGEHVSSSGKEYPLNFGKNESVLVEDFRENRQEMRNLSGILKMVFSKAKGKG